MKGYVFAAGEEEVKPVRHLRQIFEFFKEHSDPRKVNDKLVFSIGEGECQLVFTCQATVGRHYYFAITFLNDKPFFWITHRHIWDQIKNISLEDDWELTWTIPKGFTSTDEGGKWEYAGPWKEGMALLQSSGFTWCAEMEEKLCDEDF
jgi:hypothetical protein